MKRKPPGWVFKGPRRGVTLVEMLVTVGILVLIMAIIVQVFRATTGAVSGAQTAQQLDDADRLLDATIRADLAGATARFTPPLDPNANLGYFEYGENEFADNQGEDSDDYIKFTAKAPPGRPFLGRAFLPPPGGSFAALSAAQQAAYIASMPITVSSEYAEIIYFLRNGNLYRRVLLVDPDRNLTPSQTLQMLNNVHVDSTGNSYQLAPGQFGVPVSWQGMNDYSAHPAATYNSSQSIIFNSLGDLTNRENRFASPRFANDFASIISGQYTPGADGIPDDLNFDNVPDYYPTLYPNVINTGLINTTYPTAGVGLPLMAFPFVYPGMYSVPQTLSNNGAALAGWIHSPTPMAYVNNSGVTFDTNPLLYLTALNHNPLDVGDNLPIPPNQLGFVQTYWGFPTWRETLSSAWNDPTYPLFGNTPPNYPSPFPGPATPPTYPFGQPNGLVPRSTSIIPINDDGNTLPAMTAIWRNKPQLFTDGIGVNNQFFPPNTPLWNYMSWEDDLIMSNVRSFDVKAYDSSFGGYVDLGWGDDLRLYLPYANYAGYLGITAPPALLGTPLALVWPPVNPQVEPTAQTFNTILQTFAHEGRMPPLPADQRFDAQYGAVPAGFYGTNTNYTGNLGDPTPGIVRLRRVWDSWSTKYSAAPGTGVNPATGSPLGPPFTPPVYPSYPPPYPAPLRGIQIQIRIQDPAGQRVKSLTIRQDFTDKL